MEKHGNSDEQCARLKTPPLACDADAILAAVKAWQVEMKDHRNSDAHAWQRKHISIAFDVDAIPGIVKVWQVATNKRGREKTSINNL